MLAKPNREIREQNTLMRGRLARFLVSRPTRNLAYTNANIVCTGLSGLVVWTLRRWFLMFESFRGFMVSSRPSFWPKGVGFSGSNNHSKERLVSTMYKSPTVRLGSEVIKTIDDPGKFRARYCNLTCVASRVNKNSTSRLRSKQARYSLRPHTVSVLRRDAKPECGLSNGSH